MTDCKGIWDAVEKSKPFEYKELTAESLEDFLTDIIKHNIKANDYYRPFVVPVGEFGKRALEATLKQDEEALKQLREEAYLHTIEDRLRLAEGCNLEYDLVFMLCETLQNKSSMLKKYPNWVVNHKYIGWGEFKDEESLTIDLQYKEGKWILRKYKSNNYGYIPIELLWEREITEDAVFRIILRNI